MTVQPSMGTDSMRVRQAASALLAEHGEGADGVGVGDDDGGGDALAGFEQDAFAGKDLRDGHAGRDDRAGLLRGVAEVEGDHAHAAGDVAPHAGHAAEASRGVVEADGGGAGVEGAGVGADDALAEIGGLQARVAEIVLDELGHRPVEEQMAGFLIVAEALVDLFGGGGVADPEISWARMSATLLAGRRASRRRRKVAFMAFQPSTSPGAKRRTSASHRSSSSQSWMLVPSRKGTKRPLTAGVQSKAARGECELFDDQRMQQAGEIGAGRHPDAGEGLFDGAGAADALAASRTRTRLPARAR